MVFIGIDNLFDSTTVAVPVSVKWRRTGYPALTPAPGAGKPTPRRVSYGPNDPLFNPTNWEAATSGYTVGRIKDSQDARIWWDKL